MGEALLSGVDQCNLMEEHVYRGKVTFGAASISSTRSRFVTVARTAAGKYTATLPRIYRSLDGATFAYRNPTATAVLFPVVTTDNVATDGTIAFELRTEAGTATEPASGENLFFEFVVSNNPNNDYSV